MSSKETHRSGQIANRLDGKVALITGGSRGIGAAIALRFAAEGARVAISYKRNRAAAEAVVAKLTEQGGDGIAIRADVSSEAETHAIIDDLVGMYNMNQRIRGLLTVLLLAYLGVPESKAANGVDSHLSFAR